MLLRYSPKLKALSEMSMSNKRILTWYISNYIFQQATADRYLQCE